MSHSRRPVSRLALASFIFGGGAVLWIIGQGPAAVSAAAQAQAQSYFMGGNPSRVETKMTVARSQVSQGQPLELAHARHRPTADGAGRQGAHAGARRSGA